MTDADPHSHHHEELERLKERKWDIMDELAANEIAITAILNHIRGVS